MGVHSTAQERIRVSPNGRLRLRIKNVSLRGAQEVWSDRKSHRIEDDLNAFVASVVIAAERQRLDKIEAELRRQEAIKAEHRQKAIQLQYDADDVLKTDLKHRLDRWHAGRELNGFADAVEAAIKADGTPIAPDSPIDRWLAWARHRAGRLEKRALDVLTLKKDEHAWKLREKFGWHHKVTTADALQLLFSTVEELVAEAEGPEASD